MCYDRMGESKIIGYEKLVIGRVFGKYKFYDKETKKKYGHLSKAELDKIFFAGLRRKQKND